VIMPSANHYIYTEEAKHEFQDTVKNCKLLFEDNTVNGLKPKIVSKVSEV